MDSGSSSSSSSGGGSDGGNDATADSGGDDVFDGGATTPDTGPEAGPDTGVDAAPPCNLIDDLATVSGAILTNCGRLGGWYTYNDGSGVQTPTPGMPFTSELIPAGGGVAPSLYGMHTTGTGFISGGVPLSYAAIAFDLNNPTGTAKTPYDASMFTGFTFWAKAATGTAATLRVMVPDRNTDPAGGLCTACNDHCGVNVTLTATWQPYTISFATMHQLNFGMPTEAAPVTSALYSIQFQFSDDPDTFDLWLGGPIAFTP
jgi:hypothetical protein